LIVIIGKSGQLAQGLVELSKQQKIDSVCYGREDIDLFSVEDIVAKLSAIKATALVNASAYTAVDKAETDENNAYALNEKAVLNLSLACKALGIHLVHVSTDYVFAGDKGSPYLPDDNIAPTGIYGASKAAGEHALLCEYAQHSCVLRTSWVYSPFGNNFVKTMLRLMQEKPELGVIDDQIGSPTSVTTLAQVCLQAAAQKLTGVHHVSDEGVASWYDFACAIQQLGYEIGILSSKIPIKPITTKAYPTPAKRPAYSVMSKASLKQALPSVTLPHWREALVDVVSRLK